MSLLDHKPLHSRIGCYDNDQTFPLGNHAHSASFVDIGSTRIKMLHEFLGKGRLSSDTSYCCYSWILVEEAKMKPQPFEKQIDMKMYII